MGEATIGRDRGLLVPVMMETTHLDPPFNNDHVVNFTFWTDTTDRTVFTSDTWRDFVAAIGKKIGRPGLGRFAAAYYGRSRQLLETWMYENPDDPLVEVAEKEIEDIDRQARRRMLETRRGLTE